MRASRSSRFGDAVISIRINKKVDATAYSTIVFSENDSKDGMGPHKHELMDSQRPSTVVARDAQKGRALYPQA